MEAPDGTADRKRPVAVSTATFWLGHRLFVDRWNVGELSRVEFAGHTFLGGDVDLDGGVTCYRQSRDEDDERERRVGVGCLPEEEVRVGWNVNWRARLRSAW